MEVSYVKNKDLGYNPENVILVRSPVGRSEKIKVLKEKAMSIPGVISVGMAHNYPGYRLADHNLETVHLDIPLSFIWVDYDTMEVLGIEIEKQFSESDGFNFLIPDLITTPVDNEFKRWAWTYLLLSEEAVPDHLIGQITNFIANNRGESFDEIKREAYLQKITGIHLHSHKLREIEPNGAICSFISMPKSFFSAKPCQYL